MVAKHGIWSQPYSNRVCSTWQWQNQDTTHVGTWLGNTKGFFVLHSHDSNRATPITILTRSQPFLSKSISTKEYIKRFHIQFITQSHYTLPKRTPRVDLQWLRIQLNDLPKDYLTLFQTINPKSTIHTRRIPLRL